MFNIGENIHIVERCNSCKYKMEDAIVGMYFFSFLKKKIRYLQLSPFADLDIDFELIRQKEVHGKRK